MHFSRVFIERQIMTTLVTFAILLFGIVGFRALPISALPSVDYPTIQVTAAQPGANPETMASSIATPLERAFSTIAGLRSMSSSNVQGVTTITMQFTLDRDIDAAAQDVQDAIAQAILPPMPRPPSYAKQNFTVQSTGQLTQASAYRPLIVQWRNGVPLRLEELANVIDSVEDNKTIAWNNGRRGLFLAVSRQPGTNTVQIVDDIRKILPELQAALPPSVELLSL